MLLFVVEMERTRLRELTQVPMIREPSLLLVEMERTRLRELTHCGFIDNYDVIICCRNGAYPIKGIDTSPYDKGAFIIVSRNGAYPIKGIDTLRIY